MFKVTENHQQYIEAVADTVDDLSDAPTNFGTGSTCLVIEDSSVWVLGSDSDWHQI